MSQLLTWGAAAAMVAVAAHCLVRIARHAGHRGHEVVHIAMATAMAAMFAGIVAGPGRVVLLGGFGLAAAWLAVEAAVRRRPGSGGLCLSSLAMAVMAWAMARHGTMSDHAMAGMAMPTSADPLRTGLVGAALGISAALVGWALSRRRPRDAVMGGAMALMLGTML